MYGNSGRPQVAPVTQDEEVDVKIEAVGEKGDGVARVRGFVVFVPKTKAGDEVRIKITKVLKSVGFGEVVGKTKGPVSRASAPKRREVRYNPPEPTYEPRVSVEDTEDFGSEFLDEDEQPIKSVNADSEKSESEESKDSEKSGESEEKIDEKSSESDEKKPDADASDKLSGEVKKE